MASEQDGIHYEPLDEDGFDIRVLRILPGPEDDPVACTLERYVEATGNGWTCLSYTWGTAPASHEISLNGCPFLVKPDLYQFLRQARHRNIGSPLWIDAICIDQSDLNERNSQVGMMQTIFKKANQVIAWLGPGNANVESALDKLAKDLVPSTTRLSVAVATEVFAKITSAECDALLELCGAAFWTRRWIIQELWLADLPIIWCGSASLAVPAFIAAVEALVDYFSVHNHAPPSSPKVEAALENLDLAGEGDDVVKCLCEKLSYTAMQRRCSNVLVLATPRQTKDRTLDLPWLLEAFTSSACSDFHDYVYAFRGLLREGDALQVTYRAEPEEVLSQTLDFVATTSPSRFRGGVRGVTISERKFLSNLCWGLGVGRSELETLFSTQATVYLAQVGQVLELGRKTVRAWAFVDSIVNPADFVNSPWRKNTTCRNCHELMEHNIVLNELVLHPESDQDEPQVWLRGVDDVFSYDLSYLRAAYEPSTLYNFSPRTKWMMKDFVVRGRPMLALAFNYPATYRHLIQPWLDGVRDHFVVTVADSDDGGRALLMSTVPACDSAECLLSKHT